MMELPLGFRVSGLSQRESPIKIMSVRPIGASRDIMRADYVVVSPNSAHTYVCVCDAKLHACVPGPEALGHTILSVGSLFVLLCVLLM